MPKVSWHFPAKVRVPQARLDSERIAVLERKIGQQTMEIDFLKKSCGVSRSIPWGSSPMAVPHLPANPGNGQSCGRRESTLSDHRPEPSRMLPFSDHESRQAGLCGTVLGLPKKSPK